MSESTALVEANSEVIEQPTSQQMRLNAISALAAKAYAGASQLILTSEEQAALLAPVPDQYIHGGAGGKADLLYVEHTYIRRLFNKVFGVGQWSIIILDRWVDHFAPENKKPFARVYVDAMLLVRGYRAAEASDCAEFYPHNPMDDFATTLEKAKSGVLGRLAKELGVGLELWDKGFAQEFRNRQGRSAQPAPQEGPQWTAKSEELRYWLSDVKPGLKEFNEYMHKEFVLLKGEDYKQGRVIVYRYATQNGWLFDEGSRLFVSKDAA